jgi:hypothetical protein
LELVAIGKLVGTDHQGAQMGPELIEVTPSLIGVQGRTIAGEG